MTTAGLIRHRLAAFVLSLALAACFAGCSSTKVDWNSRIGVYTYDQAIAELGPPDKSARLSDESTVAEWMTRRGSPGSSGMAYGGGVYGRPYSGGYRYYGGPTFYVQTPTPDWFLRLTFGPDGRLREWKKVARPT